MLFVPVLGMVGVMGLASESYAKDNPTQIPVSSSTPDSSEKGDVWAFMESILAFFTGR
jgi:hypothetical protein